MGPDERGFEALIDTTEASFDTLFTVDPTTNMLLIEQDLDDFEIGDLNDLIGAIDLDPIAVDVSIGSLESQTFDNTEFGDPIGLFVTPEIDLGDAPVNSAVPSYPVGSVLVPPSVDLISLSDVSVEAVVLSSSTAGVNQFTFTLNNDLAAGALTDGSGNPPVVVLERPEGGSTLEIARVAFPGTIAPGTERSATMSVAGATLTSDTVYRLEIGNDQGDALIDADPTGVQLSTVVAPLEYADTHVSSISAQPSIDASGDAISLNSADADFSGILAAGGELVITMDNSLPIPVTLTSLSIRNLVDVGSLAAPSTMLDLGDLPPGTDLGIPARGSLELRFPLAGASIASEIDVTVTATSPGVASSSVIRSADGLFTTVSGTVEVDELYFVPDEEVFTSKGALDIDVDDVTFNSGEDYVELLSGSLMIEELANEMDLDFKMLQFSLPNFRVAPYGPGDSLVIAFEGTSEDPGYHRYRSLKRTTTRTNIDVDLAGVRIYPTNSQATYNVYGVSESGIPSALDASSKIRASLVPEYLEIATVNASMAPISVAMTDDVDGDDKLELFSDAEANVMDLGSLDSVRELEIDGLQLNGTELTFSIDSNIGADITFYAAMVGIKDDGTQVFLQGRNDLAVSAADTMAAQFLVNGSPIAAENLIAFEIPGTPDANETVTRTIRINNANSNLDAFLSSLPKEMRYVGKGIVQGIGGQRVQLQKPFVLNASLGAGIPVSLAGNARFEDVFEVDLSDLDELTDPDADVTINGASLIISYGNGLPLGLDAAIEVMDAFDETLTSLPGDDADGWILQAASTGSDGTATDATEGTLEFAVSEAQLRAMSAGQKVRLRLTLRTGEGTPATLRASDTLQLSVQGRFDIAVPVNLD